MQTHRSSTSHLTRLRLRLHKYRNRLKWLRLIGQWQARYLPASASFREKTARWINLLTLDEQERVRWRLPGTQCRLSLDLRDSIQWRLYYFGSYQGPIAGLVKQYLRDGSAFVDLGAHIGLYSLLAGDTIRRNGWSRACVYAFEPHPDIFRQLNSHVADNHLQDLVFTFNAAVTNACGRAALHLANVPNTGNSSLADLRGDHPNAQTGQRVEVDAITLDAFFEGRPMPAGRRIGLLKADVEGAELRVLQGSRAVLSEHRPALILEAHAIWMERFGYSYADLRRFLDELGYSIHLIRDQGPPILFSGDALPDRANDLLCLPAQPGTPRQNAGGS